MYSGTRGLRSLTVLFQFVILCTVISTAFGAEKYHFASIEGLAEQKVGGIVLPAIYKKLGIDIRVTPMPGKRAEKEARSGAVDGEIMRIWSYGEENPTTVRVPTPYYQLETRAFVHDKSIVIDETADLSQYCLVKVRGVKHTNNITTGMECVHDVGTTCQMMKFLLAGRADVALTNTMDGIISLKSCELSSIQFSAKPLAVWELYHYIHKDRKELVPQVDTIIKKMIASGEMQELIEKAEQTVMDRY